jgi:hypothetical protein
VVESDATCAKKTSWLRSTARSASSASSKWPDVIATPFAVCRRHHACCGSDIVHSGHALLVGLTVVTATSVSLLPGVLLRMRSLGFSLFRARSGLGRIRRCQ